MLRVPERQLPFAGCCTCLRRQSRRGGGCTSAGAACSLAGPQDLVGAAFPKTLSRGEHLEQMKEKALLSGCLIHCMTARTPAKGLL